MTITTRLFPSIHHLNTTISSIATDMGLLQERITSTGVGSITSVQVLVCCAVLYRLYYMKMIVMVIMVVILYEDDCDGDHGRDTILR